MNRRPVCCWPPKRNDVIELERLLHKELLFTNQRGRLITKAMELEIHRSGRLIINILRVKEYQISLISDVAVSTSVTYLTGKHREKILAGTFRFNRVWKKEGGNWQVIAGSCVELT